MFDLEQSIADWRRQMLAAGIKTPVPLEELEIHLREEIERQMQSGFNSQQSFEFAVRRIGRGFDLKTEFAKAKGLLGLTDEIGQKRINRFLGALWLAQSLWGLIILLPVLGQVLPFPRIWLTLGFFYLAYLAFVLIIFIAGAFGSVLLFQGAKLGHSIIRIIALVSIIERAAEILAFKSFSVRGGIFTAFYLISIWLLRSPKHKEPKLAVK